MKHAVSLNFSEADTVCRFY